MNATKTRNTYHLTLRVIHKGVDLFASTATLALRDKMGYADRLLGLTRMDYFQLTAHSEAPADRLVANLRRVLDRQAIFYNRNKHLFSLECEAVGKPAEPLREGFAPAELAKRWKSELARDLQKQGSEESYGKEPAGTVTLTELAGFLVEVLVEDDDKSARDAIATKVTRELSALNGTGESTVTCETRGTVWWLALRAPDVARAKETAEEITITRQRVQGLLANPNYQRASVLSAKEL